MVSWKEFVFVARAFQTGLSMLTSSKGSVNNNDIIVTPLELLLILNTVSTAPYLCHILFIVGEGLKENKVYTFVLSAVTVDFFKITCRKLSKFGTQFKNLF